MAAAATVAASRARMPRSATLGALVFLGGASLMYWALVRSRDGKGLFGLGPNAVAGGSFLEGAARSSGIMRPGGPKNALPGAPDASDKGAGSDAKFQ